ncbi:MAG: DUF3482 domain-containing protein [Sandaracinaceae bacterium]|nr:DUF3482 domain-containing protein [Myxococcales bacterium]MCB9659188.1 DUF3482 domain-containing protein [Sandaracinaceae bacterium]
MTDRATTGAPTFAVVGRVNKGKSSVIASLIENDRVKISPRPGTTTECVRYNVAIDGETLFTVIDTPGFEDAPRALHWMKSRETSAAERPQLVRDFVETFTNTDEFTEECRLLQPILDGACILYVVNGDEPYRPNYEAEMEILRYTGRPTMALINRSSSGRYLDEWQRALDQFFKLVRQFDAHGVTYRDRRELLAAFRLLTPRESAQLDKALSGLALERQRRRYEVAGIAADLLVDALSYHLTIVLSDAQSLDLERARLEAQFHDALRGLELTAHRKMAEVFLHRLEGWSPETAADLESGDDLFAEETWNVMGLSPSTLVALSAISGAAAGGAIDAAVGGASFMTGAVLGGLGGLGLGVYELNRRFASASTLSDQVESLLNARRGGQRVRVGPHPSINFPFVLLARACVHFERIRAWAHAVPELPAAPIEPGSALAGLDGGARKRLAEAFKQVRKKHRNVPRELRWEIHQVVRALFDAAAGEDEG